VTSEKDPLGWLGTSMEDRFAIEQQVGEGGFGIVYRGTHLGFDEPVAVKCLKVPATLTEDERAKFLAELRAEAKILHRLSRKTAGIVQALDVGAATSPRGVWTPYIVMEWLEGETLEQEIARRYDGSSGRRSIEDAVSLLAPVAQSLALSHAERIAHLDIKPANIFLATDGSVKLLDFGIAKALTTNQTVSKALTASGAMPAFTPNYAAPEQFNRRHGEPGPWTDVFAFALVLVECCSGEFALTGDTPLQLYVAAANEQYRPTLAAHGVQVRQTVDDVVRRALEVDPRRRYPAASAFWNALTGAMDVSPLEPPNMVSLPPQSIAIVPAGLSAPAPLSVARTAHHTAAQSTGLHRVCTMLLAEIEGTEEAAEHIDPEHLSAIVERCMALLSRAVESAGGAVERVVGDTLMGAFGLYGQSASAAERAVHAALAMGPALTELAQSHRLLSQLRLGVRIGISTGRVFLSGTQATGGFALAVTGAPVKLAGRLQQQATAGTVVVDRDTHRQVAGLFEAELMVPAGDAAGRPARTLAYRITGAARERHPLNVDALRDFCGIESRFVDRAAEMEALESAADTAATERCARFVTLIGAPGNGRSRLLAELADRLEREDWVVFAAQGSALHTQASYALAATLLRSHFHLHEDDSLEVITAKLERGLRVLRGLSAVDSTQSFLSVKAGRLEGLVDTEEIIRQLVRLLGLGDGHGPTPLSAGQQGSPAKHRIAGALASMFGFAQQPVAILCDDLQWADEATLGLLEDLCLRLSDMPLLVVAAARPELLDRHPYWGEGESWHCRVEVGALARRHLEAMVKDRLKRAAELPVPVVKRLAEHADGSPLTLVETLYLLVDAGVIDTAANPWQVHGDRLGELSLPTSVHGIVQARLDRLDEAARVLLARAAVVGRTFWDGVLCDLGPEGSSWDAGFVRTVLSELRERGLIRARGSSTFPDEQEYVFAEAATQQVANRMLGHKERRALHGVVAQWLGERTAADAGAALVARHYERAAMLEEAFTAYRRAGAHAALLGQHVEALHCFDRASHICDWMSDNGKLGESTAELFIGWEQPEDGRVVSWPERVALRTELGDVHRHMGEFEAAERRYREARESIIPVERRTHSDIDPAEVPRWQARLDYRRALLEKHRGSVDEPRQLLEGALDRAREGGLGEERAEMWALFASLHRRDGKIDECRQACIQGLRVCRSIKNRATPWRQAVSKLLNTLGGMFFSSGRLVPAERCFLQAARIIDERNSPEQASHALNNVAAVRYSRGDLDGARECFERVLHLSERAGDLWVRMTVLANLGEVELGLGRHKLAFEFLSEGVRIGEQLRAHLDLPEVYRHLATASRAVGAAAQALDAATRALELARGEGAKTYLGGVLTTAAEVCASIAQDDQIEPDVRQRARALAGQVLAALDGAAGASLSHEVADKCRELLADLPLR